METNAFLILLPLILIVLFSEPIYRHWRSTQPVDFSKDARELDSIIAQLQWDTPESLVTNKKLALARLFFFDPNTVSQEEFIKLGLSATISSRIVHFREKGGRFRKKTDLQKIYGMDTAWFYQVKEWIRIPEKAAKPTFMSLTEKKHSLAERMDINKADSLQLVKVYGIGPALSRRIRTFRDKLGGFISMDQLNEVYGLDTAVVRQLRKRFFIEENFQPRKININTATRDELSHPYIRWKEAQAILSFRLQHGRFTSLSQLNEIKILTKEWTEKVSPYLTVD
jgi:competence protein ComEA